MFKERLKRLLLGGGESPSSPPAKPGEALPSKARGPAGVEALPAYSRHSHGFEQFSSQIQGCENLWILDFSGAVQENVSFITGLGHRLYSLDVLRTIDATFDTLGDDPFEDQSNPEKIRQFLDENLNLENEFFDGALLWNALEFLAPPLLEATVDRLYQVIKPGSCLLAFFHADEKATAASTYTYRIADPKTLLVTPRGQRQIALHFNNRAIEKLFSRYRSVKFFLARDKLREVIVTK